MSVSKMKRLVAAAPKKSCDEAAKALVWLSCVDVDVSPGIDDAELTRLDLTDEEKEIDTRLSDTDVAVNLLSGRDTVARRGLLSPKPEMEYGGEPEERLRRACGITDEACGIQKRIDKIKSERAAVASELAALLPWRELELPMSFTGTQKTELITGSFPSGTDIDIVLDELNGAAAYETVYKQVREGITYCCFIVYKPDLAIVHKRLTAAGFVKAPLPEKDETANAFGERLEEKIIDLDSELVALYRRADELAPLIDEVKMLGDTQRTRKSFISAKQRMASTESTVLITGWVPEASENEVADELERLGCAYEMSDPGEEDDPPVLLVNNKFAESFEPVVSLYSLPKYGTFDPTFVMSFFYIVIFAFMFADFGYGLIMMLACTLGCIFLKPRGSLNKFLRMFAICGIACMVTGILFGGYFGDLPTKMAVGMFGAEEERDLALWFNPINDPMLFLVVSLVIGAVHLVAALSLKFYVLCKTQTFLDALFDAGAWILVFLGAGVAVVGILTENAMKTVGIIIVVIGYLILIATQGRHEKTIVMKIAKGLLALYDTVSYVSDLLSYSRILSLGLASAVIASVFNLLGTMGGLTFGGIIIFIIAVLVGHSLNIAINVLGTFVHTSRLQYIEFFGKFYEDGGRAFVPLEPSAKYHVYKLKNKSIKETNI